MNLRTVAKENVDYMVGLDIGTGSVGWAVLSEQGELLKFKGNNTWGSRLFENAQTAAVTRQHRSLRRRYNRRTQRIMDLRLLMLPEVEKVDSDFFKRMNQSSLWKDDRSFSEPYVLFNDSAFSEKDYFNNYKTIYHLRRELVNGKEKADIRLIYLALHHMLKYRGNFLIEGQLSAKSADATQAIAEFVSALDEYCQDNAIEWDSRKVDKRALDDILTQSPEKRRERQESFSKALCMSTDCKKLAKAVGDAVFGYAVNYSHVFEIEDSADAKISFEKEDKVEEFCNTLLPEENERLFASLQGLHNAYILAGIIKGAPGETISGSMVALYEQHSKDLKELKRLVKTYLSRDDYYATFRGPQYADGTYKKSGSKGYTAFLLGQNANNKTVTETFYKYLTDIFNDVSFNDEDQKVWNEALKSMDSGTYLRKLRMSDNGAIPHQFHLEEMHAILENQKQYYPALAENQEKIESLLNFRLPYYVGPLGNQSNPQRKKPFAWAIRYEGKEDIPIKPWNFDQVVDKDATAEAFITNLIGECSYYLGKPVIPKNSLLYSEFCVRNELNVCKMAADGERLTRMDVETVEAIYNGVFKSNKRVKTSAVSDFLKRELKLLNTTIAGTQKETEFGSSLASYCDFKKILGCEIETFEDYEMVENLITWVTVFEDKAILKRRINMTYGPKGSGALSEEQVKAICKLRYTGWSNLSREFLQELRIDFEGIRVSIMDVLRNSRKRTQMNLMEILADERFNFSEVLAAKNEEYIKDASAAVLDDIPGSPAIKRGINQSLKVVEEITHIAGKAPAKICVEMAREEAGKGKGSRTKTRARELKEWLDAITKDMQISHDKDELSKELDQFKDELDKKRLFLYFLQAGKCMYCGKSLDINRLSEYDIDHIIPQSIVKDDSVDNTVLVHASCNRTDKLDSYPLPESIRKQNIHKWEELKRAGFISTKKFENLACSSVSDRRMQGFINRQLVETRQISKHVVTLLEAEYPDTAVETIKAELTYNLREQYGLYKCRSVNDYHHAHDAYLACQMSRFISIRFSAMAKDLTYSSVSKYTYASKSSHAGSSGLIVNSFKFDGFDKTTGEIVRDEWDAEIELKRIRTCLSYKDCFISHKLEKGTGEFWNQTVYSRRIKTDKAIPLKKGLDPKKYGYYQGANQAYYVAIEHLVVVRKKKRVVTSLIGIPVNAAYTISSKFDLQVYLEQLYEKPRILKGPIMKYQLIEWGGCRYYLVAATEMINARQLWLPSRFMKYLARDDHYLHRTGEEEASENAAVELYDYLCLQAAKYYQRYKGVSDKLSDKTALDHFQKLTIPEKWDVVEELLGLLHCDSGCGMKAIGLSPALGRMMNINFGASFQDIHFIDVSSTGMFERRSDIEF